MTRNLLTVVFVSFFLCSCEVNSGFDKESIALVPVENIQYVFERDFSEDSFSFILEKRGNVLLVKDVKQAVSFVTTRQTQFAFNPNMVFIWDTLKIPKKLFLIDTEKAFYLNPESTKQVETEDEKKAIEITLNQSIKSDLSLFLTKQIGKETIAIDKHGFVAGANQLGRSKTGSLLIKE